MPASMETADAVMKEVCGEVPKRPVSVEYNVTIMHSGCRITVMTYDEEQLAELVHLIKGYLNAS